MRLSKSLWHDSLMPLLLCVMVSENDSSVFAPNRDVLFCLFRLSYFSTFKSVCVFETLKKKILAGPKSNSLIVNSHPSDALNDAMMRINSLFFWNRLELKF